MSVLYPEGCRVLVVSAPYVLGSWNSSRVFYPSSSRLPSPNSRQPGEQLAQMHLTLVDALQEGLLRLRLQDICIAHPQRLPTPWRPPTASWASAAGKARGETYQLGAAESHTVLFDVPVAERPPVPVERAQELVRQVQRSTKVVVDEAGDAASRAVEKWLLSSGWWGGEVVREGYRLQCRLTRACILYPHTLPAGAGEGLRNTPV